MIVFGLLQIELGENAADMLLDRALGDPQLPSDARVGAALGHQRQYLSLAWAEPGQWVISVACSNQFGDEGRIDYRAAPSYPT